MTRSPQSPTNDPVTHGVMPLAWPDFPSSMLYLMQTTNSTPTRPDKISLWILSRTWDLSHFTVIRGAKKVPALEVLAALEDADSSEKKPEDKLVGPNQPIGALAMATAAISFTMLLS
ncbi:hypothetical protein PILCRDRAFT_644956 [Piloderma croceum F 1598]|uniref:Uncharacterized protein n=1 Tax=Piloderma croceum (strain F 1598) TaxID=765440 RepID=A0A0C3ARD2_PILCF|nr:hypothetical protein PILCRDRAFT_644956 [Piloderma croceum F 1598]